MGGPLDRMLASILTEVLKNLIFFFLKLIIICVTKSILFFRVNYTLVPCGLTLFHFGTLWFET